MASLQPTFASLDALDPGMIKLSVAVISAVLEPMATASATAVFARFLGNTALGTPVLATAHRGCTCRRKCLCRHMDVNIR